MIRPAKPRKWLQLTKLEAQSHPLYGLKGWLLVLLVLQAIGFATLATDRELQAQLALLAQLSALLRLDPIFAVQLLLTGLLALLVTVTLVAGFGLLRAFRDVAICAFTLALLLDLVALVYAVSQGGSAWAIGLPLVRILLTLPSLLYVISSQRVRVTYQWQVFQDDLVAQGSQQRAMTHPEAASGGRWVQLTQWEAERHSLHGVAGSLRAILNLAVAEIVLGAILVATSRPSLLLIAVVAVLAVVKGWVLYLGFDLRPRFRTIVLAYVALQAVAQLTVAFSGLTGPGGIDTAYFLAFLLSCAVFGYFLSSRRVRVTYLWQIGVDDPQLEAVRRPSDPRLAGEDRTSSPSTAEA